MSEANTRTEFRALVRRPASILDSPEDREVGHVDEWSAAGKSKDAVKQTDYRLCRSEETLARVVRWQVRTVTLGEWEDDQ